MKNATIFAAFAVFALVSPCVADPASDDLAARIEEMAKLLELAKAVPPETPVTNSTGVVMVIHTNGATTVSGPFPGKKNARIEMTTRVSLRVAKPKP